MKYTLSIEKSASIHAKKGIDYYNSKLPKQGNRFKKAISKHFDALEINPFYQVRYNDIRCLPINKYPYMIYFSVDETKKIVIVHAILHTSQNNTNLVK